MRGTTRCVEVSIDVNGAPSAGSPVTAIDGVFEATVDLRPGRNTVRASCTTDDGEEQSAELVLNERLVPRPTARIRTQINRDVVQFFGADSAPSEFDGAAIMSYRWSERETNPEPLRPAGSDLEEELSSAAVPDKGGEYYVSLTVTDEEGRTDTAQAYFVVEDGKPRIPDAMTEHAAWIDRAIVYGTVPPLFGNNGFRSVQRKLDYLKEVGVTALWLAPSFRTPEGDYGYAVTDYFELREDYGTKDDFRALVEAAHERGIRVLMDFVPNHTSDQHPYFQDAKQNGRASHYWDYYERDEAGNYTHYFDWTNLPNLNYDNPEVRNMITEAFSYWVREFDVDGFRVDACWGVRQRRPDYWPEWRREMNRIKPDLLLIAEASAREGYWFTHGFDVAYDWTEDLGHWAWEGVPFDSPETIHDWLDAALTNSGEGYHDDALIFRFMNNNDTGSRFVGKFGTDATRVTAAMLLTLPGVPELFTGDEIGAMYEPYYDRNPLVWKDKFALHDYYVKLISLRQQIPSLRSREWRRVTLEPTTGAYAYLRPGSPAERPALVVLNWGNRTTFTLPKRSQLRPLAEAASLTDVLTGRRVDVGSSGPAKIPMEAKSARILVADGTS